MFPKFIWSEPYFPETLSGSSAVEVSRFGKSWQGKKTVTGLFRLDQDLHVLCYSYYTVTLCLEVSFANPVCKTEHSRPHCYPLKGLLTKLASWLGTWVSGGFLAFSELRKDSLCLFIQTIWLILNTWLSFWESGIWHMPSRACLHDQPPVNMTPVPNFLGLQHYTSAATTCTGAIKHVLCNHTERELWKLVSGFPST